MALVYGTFIAALLFFISLYCPLLCSFVAFYCRFDRAKAAGNAPLTLRGGLLGHNEKPSMHLTKEKYTFDGRCKLPSMATAPKMNILFIFPPRQFFFRVHNEVFSNSYKCRCGLCIVFIFDKYY